MIARLSWLLVSLLFGQFLWAQPRLALVIVRGAPDESLFGFTLPPGGDLRGFMVNRTVPTPHERVTVAAANMVTIGGGGIATAPPGIETMDRAQGWKIIDAHNRGVEVWARPGLIGSLLQQTNERVAVVGSGVGDYFARDFRRIERLSEETLKPTPRLLIVHSETDSMATAVRSLAASYQTVILLSLPPSSESQPGPVSPIRIWTADGSQALALSSTSTKTPGLLLNYDLTLFILSRLGFPRPAGLPGGELTMSDNLNVLDGFEERIRERVQARTQVNHAPWVLFVLTSAAGLLAFYGRSNRQLLDLAPMLGAVIVAYLLMLVTSTYAWFWLFALGAVGLGLAARRSRSAAHGVALALGCGVMVDWALGAPFGSQAAWGPIPAWGTRFYGVGNQQAAVGIGLVLLGCTGVQDARTRNWALCLGLFASGVLLFLAGINGGAAAAALVGSAFACKLAKPSRQTMLGFAALGLATLVVLAAFAPGHLGRVGGLGVGGILSTAAGKLLFNFEMVFSAWSLLLAGSIFASRQLGLERRFDWTVWWAAAAAAFFLNDLGIVMAAILAAFAVVSASWRTVS